MITRQIYPYILIGYHLAIAIVAFLVWRQACRAQGIADVPTRLSKAAAWLAIVEAMAMTPMVIFVGHAVRIRDEGLNFMVTHTILVVALQLVGCVLILAAKQFRLQLIMLNLLSIPFVVVAWLSG